MSAVGSLSGGEQRWVELPIPLARTLSGRGHATLGEGRVGAYTLPAIFGPEAVGGLTSSLKKMRFVELFVREVTTFIGSIGMGLQQRKNIMK